MDVLSIGIGLVVGLIVGGVIGFLLGKLKGALAVGISEQVTLLTMQNEQAAEMKKMEDEKRKVECRKADLDKESAHMKMKLQLMKEEFAQLSAPKDNTSAPQSDQETSLQMQVASIQKKIAKAENILANLNVHGADYECRRETLEKERSSLQEKISAIADLTLAPHGTVLKVRSLPRQKLSAHEEELKNVPQMDPTARTELQLRRGMEVAEMQKYLTRELCRIEESLKMLEMERSHIDQRREELACRIHCMQERYTSLTVGLRTGGRGTI